MAYVPDYALIGIYTSKEVAIKVAKEWFKKIEESHRRISENNLFDCDTYETTTIHFDEIKADNNATTVHILFSLGNYGEYSLISCYCDKDLVEKRRALLQKQDDEIMKMVENYQDQRQYFVIESQINEET